MLPDYFYEVPASSSGKYHSSTCLGRSGLVRHTKAATMIAMDLFRIGLYNEMFTSREKQLIIVALIVHDGLKSGCSKQDYTCANHPLLISDLIQEKIGDMLPELEMQQLLASIRSHMGIWNQDYRTKKEILPVPTTDMEWFVHLCDYLASRPYLTYEFGKDYFILDTEDEQDGNELSNMIKEIVVLCKQRIKNGIERDSLIQIISRYNDGRKNPNSIKTVESAKKIIKELNNCQTTSNQKI